MVLVERLQEVLSGMRNPTLRELRHALREIECKPEQAAPHAKGPERLPYGRNVVWRSKDVEAIMIVLPPFTETYIHDHGDSFGCAYVVEGALLNEIFAAEGYGAARRITAYPVHAGKLLDAPGGLIHRMRNDTPERTVSLHLYAPPLSGTRTYYDAEHYVLDYVI